MKLNGQIAIVTGAGRGIGRATALALAQEGANLVLAARSISEINAVADEIRDVGREALSVATDVSRKADVDSMVQKVLDQFGKIDILVNNAGVTKPNAIRNVLEEDWDLIINVNLKGVFLCTQAVFSHMCQQGRGHIINVSSLAGKYFPNKMAAYGASKWGVVGLTGITHEEGSRHGVKATLVRPGPVDTKMRRDNHDDDLTKLPQPSDVADVILLAVTQPWRAHTPVFDVYSTEDSGGNDPITEN